MPARDPDTAAPPTGDQPTDGDGHGHAAGRPAAGDANAGRWWLLAGLLVAVALVPLLFAGPGTDLDAGAVLRSGRGIVDHLDYAPSRAPGAPVHEAGVGVLHALGGVAGANLGSLLAGVVVVWALVALLRGEGVGNRGLAAAVVVANPFFLIAATSTVDFLWALALLLAGAVQLRHDRVALAAVLCALAIGARSSTAVLVLALVVADGLDEDHRRRALLTGAGAAVGALLLFVPSFLSAHSSLSFAQNDVPTSSLPVQIGRFLVKDLYFVGPFAALVLLACLPALWRVLGRWRSDWLVRFAALGLVGSQLLFLRFPWKLGHLLPTLACLALLLAVALERRPALLWALVAAQTLYLLLNVQVVQPDNPNAATGARISPRVDWGALVIDTRCRLDDTGAWKAPVTVRQGEVDAVWDCAKPWASSG